MINNAVFVSVTYVLNQTYIEDVEKYKKLHDCLTRFSSAVWQF